MTHYLITFLAENKTSEQIFYNDVIKFASKHPEGKLVSGSIPKVIMFLLKYWPGYGKQLRFMEKEEKRKQKNCKKCIHFDTPSHTGDYEGFCCLKGDDTNGTDGEKCRIFEKYY